ncbi:ferredoxin [Streptomyces sp. NBC_00344]|uniref:ferredoxin n=1 Tax=Streptomyces sp. NBC_00344 TaxID=2975720 RepID=UPI002E240099
MKQISIDTDVCIGAGQCALTAPRVFTQDDDGFSELLPGRAEGDPMVGEAARACPVQAITLT